MSALDTVVAGNAQHQTAGAFMDHANDEPRWRCDECQTLNRGYPTVALAAIAMLVHLESVHP